MCGPDGTNGGYWPKAIPHHEETRRIHGKMDSKPEKKGGYQRRDSPDHGRLGALDKKIGMRLQ